jgi:hypothetical protein
MKLTLQTAVVTAHVDDLLRQAEHDRMARAGRRHSPRRPTRRPEDTER